MCVLFCFCVCSDAFVWLFAVVIVVAFYVVFLIKKIAPELYAVTGASVCKK